MLIMLCFVFGVAIPSVSLNRVIDLAMFLRVPTMAMEQSYVCPSASEGILKNMASCLLTKVQQSLNHVDFSSDAFDAMKYFVKDIAECSKVTPEWTCGIIAKCAINSRFRNQI